MPGTEYVWRDPDRLIAFHLPLEIVSRLGLAAMQAYKAVPHRGLEVGGLLLGRRSGRAIQVRDFLPVECEHRSGPSFRLSETDMQCFQEALRKHPDAVGLYRTSTRAESLFLQKDDVNLFRRHFTTPESVYLLIQPATGKAKIFLPDGDVLLPVHEFPFHAGDLIPETAEPDRQETPAIPAPAPVGPVPAFEDRESAPAAEVPPRAAGPATIMRRQPPKWWVGVGAVVLGMAAGAGAYQLLHSTPRPVHATPPAAAATGSNPDHVDLRVQSDGPSLRLYWDRNAVAVRNATKAVLFIHDGKHDSQLNLDPSELNTGLISYWPDTRDVTFRLETFAANHTTDDSIRVVGAATSAASTPAETGADKQPDNPKARAPQKVPQPKGSAARTDVQAEEAPEAHPSPFTPIPKPMMATPAAAASASAAAPPPAAPAAAPAVTPLRTPAKTPEPQVAMSVEPAGGSRIGHVIGHIPLLRRLKKQPQAYVPPAPVHEVRPAIGPAERRLLTRPIPVDVRVYVAETGKVQYVELLRNGATQPEFGMLAVYAARRWEFTPARMGDDKVPGEVIVHFRFMPEAPPAQVARQ